MTRFVHRNALPLALTVLGVVLGACTQGPSIPPAPQANDDHYDVRSDGALSVAGPGLLANDVAESATVSAVNGNDANVGLPTATAENGTVTVQANGAFQYAPAAAFTGTDTFAYGASNTGGSDAATVSVFVTDPWTQLASIPTPVSRPAGVFWGGRFYVIGGEAAGGARDGLVQVFDPATATWTVLPDTMPTGVSNICAAVLGDEVYVPGGYSGTDGPTTTQVLDLVTGTWSVNAAAELPESRYAHTCATLAGRIYLFGGGTNGTGANTTWLYEPSLPPGSRWVTTLATMPSAISYGGSVAVGDRIFVTGFGSPGVTDSAAVWEYTPATDEWRAYPSLQTARAAAGVWSDGTTLFVGGGGWASQHLTVEAYDLSKGTSGTWVYTDPLLEARRTFAHALDPATGHLYAAAGWEGGAYEDTSEVGRLLVTP